MADLYRSVIEIDASDKFVISFDAATFGVVGIGIDTKSVSKLNEIDKLVYLDTTGYILREGYSKIYEIDNNNNISKKQTDNSTFFGHKIEIDNGKVYEEVKDASEYNPEADTDILIRDKVLYKHFPGRYFYENGIVKANIKEANLLGIYSFENGEIKNETYLNDVDLNTKIRFVLANNAKTFDIARLDGKLYEKIMTILFKEKTEAGRIFLYLDKTEISDLLISYTNSDENA